jgi:hypothetical protein
MADGRGRSLATRVTAGQASDTRQLIALLDQVAVARPGGVGRPRKRDRNNVERGFNRRKHWRGLATRYDKRIDSYQATLDLAETLDWLRATRDHTMIRQLRPNLTR